MCPTGILNFSLGEQKIISFNYFFGKDYGQGKAFSSSHTADLSISHLFQQLSFITIVCLYVSLPTKLQESRFIFLCTQKVTKSSAHDMRQEESRHYLTQSWRVNKRFGLQFAGKKNKIK